MQAVASGMSRLELFPGSLPHEPQHSFCFCPDRDFQEVPSRRAPACRHLSLLLPSARQATPAVARDGAEPDTACGLT